MDNELADGCTRLLVADPLGLFVAPLKATDLEPLDIAELVAQLREPDTSLLPLAASAVPRAEACGRMDELTPVHPLVLRQQGRTVLAWDDDGGAYVALGPAHLAVLDLARFPTTIEYLETLAAESDWPIGVAELRQAAAELAECGLLKLQRSIEPEPDPVSAEVVGPAEDVPGAEDGSDQVEGGPGADEVGSSADEPDEAAVDELVDSDHLSVNEGPSVPTGARLEAEAVADEALSDHAPVIEEHEPGLLEDLPSGVGAAKVVAYRAAVRSRRGLHRSGIRLGRSAAQSLLNRFGVESDDWPDPEPVTDPQAEVDPQTTDSDAATASLANTDSDAATEGDSSSDVSESTGALPDPALSEGPGPATASEPAEPAPDEVRVETSSGSADESAEVEGEGQGTETESAETDSAAAEPGETAGSAGPVRFDPRTPVFAVYYSPEHNASLGLGLIMAYARVADRGALNVDFDLRKARIDADPMLDELERTGRQAIVLFSDFMWSIDHNLAVSSKVKELNPNSITVHGGPHAPKYEGDAERFFAENPHVDVLSRGEGELTVAALLAALGPNPDSSRLSDYLSEVEGITFRSGPPEHYTLVRTPDRKRATDMDEYPSPYLTGEFDEIDPARWRSATVETNRGCPYGCTFCDWGSATNSRIRQFGHDRVFAELEWLAARGISEVFLADANFGLFAHDVEVTEHIADLKSRYGAPSQIICSFAKNTVKNTAQIVRILVDAGICAEGSVALQTTDETTLANVERSNIKVEKYDALAEEFRRHRLPIVTDLLMGLPGATIESFKNDLQRCLDQEVTPRMMETVLLPNSPMNAPSYKERFKIETDEANVLVSTISYTREDFDEMRRLRLLFRACEHYGLLRHLFRWLQVEHQVRPLDLIHVIDQTIEERPEQYPLLTWVGRYFDLITAPPGGWPPFYDEVVRLLSETYGIERDSAMDTVLAVQKFLMPSHGRKFPDRLSLDHDYATWYHSTSLGAQDVAGTRPLIDMPAGELVVDDPAGICDARLLRNGFSIRREEACDNPFWVLNDWELDSELARPMATAVPLLSGS
ncbi:MAG: radical SAM protein [Microthrixaceae bacterium]